MGLPLYVQVLSPAGSTLDSYLKDGETNDYDPNPFENTDGGVPLDPFHSHHILVDGPKGWGDEIELRGKIEKQLGDWGTQVVLLVIQGGPFTFKNARPVRLQPTCEHIRVLQRLPVRLQL